MRKLLVLALAILLIPGVASAWLQGVDPQATSGATVALSVYNNSGSELDAGDVVVWDIDASTGDNDLYVTTTTTANTHLVAGVVWPKAIGTTDTGSIVVYGIAECDTAAVGAAENGDLCTSTTAGSGTNCSGNANHYAFVTAASAGGQGSCFVNVR